MYCTRMVPTVNHFDIAHISIKLTYSSCRAPSNDLDGKESSRPRRRDITEALVMTYTVPILWAQHGIIPDVIVRFSALRCHVLNRDGL